MTSNRVADLQAPHPVQDGFFDSLNLITYAEPAEARPIRLVLPASLERDLGWTEAELLEGIPLWLNSIHPADRPWVLEMIRQAHQNRSSIQCEYRVISKSGRIFWFLDIGSVREEPVLGQTILNGLRLDITGWKTLEEQRNHSRQVEANGLMASKIAHEFNNLLTLICSYTTFASESLNNHPALSDLLQVQKAAERAVGFTRRLLSLSPKRIVVGENCDLAQFFQTYANALRQISGPDIFLNIETDSQLPPVQILPAQLEQLMVILISNSREALAGGGRVDIWAGVPRGEDALHPFLEERSQNYLCLKVADNGPGLSEEVRTHLFDPFYSTKTPKGRGLGLATAHGIAKRHGGFIEALPKAAEGAQFRIYLPLHKPSPEKPSSSLEVNWAKDHHDAPAL